MFISVAALNNLINLRILVLDDQLEGTEKLLRAEFEVFHVYIDGDGDGSGFVSTVA